MLNDLRDRAYEQAKISGFYDYDEREPSTLAELITDAHLFLSKALESDRKGFGKEQTLDCLNMVIKMVKSMCRCVEDEDISDSLFTREERAVVEKICLIHSEVSEMYEAFLENDKEEEEMADVFIRLFDRAGHANFDLDKAVNEKMEKNKTRPRKHNARY